jgi:hypothetical protein
MGAPGDRVEFNQDGDIFYTQRGYQRSNYPNVYSFNSSGAPLTAASIMANGQPFYFSGEEMVDTIVKFDLDTASPSISFEMLAINETETMKVYVITSGTRRRYYIDRTRPPFLETSRY